MATTTVAKGYDDSLMMFRSRLLRSESNGAALSDALTRLARVHPHTAHLVIQMGTLGEISYASARDALTTYMYTGVATIPAAL